MARVFVIDDDQVVRRLAQAILRRGGHQVVALDNGQAALDALEQSTPDLVITDLMMPRMDGLELVRRIRAEARWAALPIVVLTARGTSADLRRVTEAKADRFLTKPFSSAQLLDVVADLTATG